MNELASSIKALRKQQHMTQGDLAARLNVTRQTVSNYENGKSEPDIEMLLRIAEVFGTDVNSLVNQKSTAPKAEMDPQLAKHLLPPALLLSALWFGKILTGHIVAYLSVKHPYAGWMSFNIISSHTAPLLYMLLGYFTAKLFSLLYPPQRLSRFKKKPYHVILMTAALFYGLIVGHELICAIRTDVLYFRHILVPDGESFISPIPLIPFFSRCLILFKTRFHLYEIITTPATILWGAALYLTKAKNTAAVK